MREKPRLFDDLGLVALPTAVSCARLFVKYTLDNWRASSFVVADAMTITGELVASRSRRRACWQMRSSGRSWTT
jgi:hypothetical protein